MKLEHDIVKTYIIELSTKNIKLKA